MALLVVPTGGHSARVRPRACQRTTFGTTTFDLLVTGVGCGTALAVVEGFERHRAAPHGWSCSSVFCWRGARTYERARARVAKLVVVTVASGPISPGRCASGRLAISARQYIGCGAARRVLDGYLGRSRLGRSLVSCSGDARTGGFCAVTFVTGAQGHFTYTPASRP